MGKRGRPPNPNRVAAIEAGESKFLGTLCPEGHEHAPGYSYRLVNNGHCIECNRSYMEEWTKNNLDKVRVYQTKSARKYRAKNREKITAYNREYMKKYRETHREEMVANQKRYLESIREKT